MRVTKIGVLCGWLLCASCSQETLPEAASNLLAVDDVAFVCARLDNGSGVHVERGLPLHECTERENRDGYALLALATQWETGEVAVIDASQCSRPNNSGTAAACLMRVLDNEASLPGVNFLPVGAQPVSVRSTPGGSATFVAVAEPGKTGIFALPTTCVGQRKRVGDDREAVRDLRTWPACRLPAAPGMLELIRDTSRTTSCDGAIGGQEQGERECPANLVEQESLQGRLKLVVTLPDLGQLWSMDAQEILDGEPGAYPPCRPEQVVRLDAERPDELLQEIPADLSSEARTYTGLAGSWDSTPTDIAVDLEASHGEMYVADRSAPVIHRLDVTDACSITQAPSLYPLSYTRPDATIATRKVALSPVIDSGKRFVYAVEESAERTAGSIMAFDVSADASQRTPLVLARSPFILNQPPDRIQLTREVSDVDFVYRDPPVVDPETGIGTTGVRCDPNPELDADDPAALVRPNASGTGAGPLQLRGLFAFASSYAGDVSVIDIDDYDAACRRPSSVNPDDAPNEYGCALDPWQDELEAGGAPTSSGEFSCHVVQPHRVRSRERFLEGVVGGVPRLAAFPRLRAEDGSSLVTDASATGLRNPRMLAVPRAGEAARVQVGPTVYATDSSTTPLIVDPARSENSSLLLPIIEPRAYATHSGDAAVTYEGLVRGVGYGMLSVGAGRSLAERPGLSHLSPKRPYGILHEGASAQLCRAGIEDEVAMAKRGAALYATSNFDFNEEDYDDAFGRYYGDYAELVEALKPESHPYWEEGGASCGSDSDTGGLDGRRVCELVFGEEGEGQRARGFHIVRALDRELIVEPRHYANTSERDALLELASCCFPDATRYIVRASHHWFYRDGATAMHQIEVGDDGVCAHDTSPLTAQANSRVFEISCASNDCGGIGEASPPDEAREEDSEEDSEEVARNQRAAWVPVCLAQSGGAPPIGPDSPLQACVYDGLTARFAVYKGQNPSERGMTFNWRIGGGFIPFAIPLADINDNNRTSTTSNPQRLFFSPELQRVVVTEGAPPSGGVAPGITLLGLENRDGAPTVTQSRIIAF